MAHHLHYPNTPVLLSPLWDQHHGLTSSLFRHLPLLKCLLNQVHKFSPKFPFFLLLLCLLFYILLRHFTSVGRREPPFQVLGSHPRQTPRPIPPQLLYRVLYLVLCRYRVVDLCRGYGDRDVLPWGGYVAVEVDPLRRDPLERSSSGWRRMVDRRLLPVPPPSSSPSGFSSLLSAARFPLLDAASHPFRCSSRIPDGPQDLFLLSFLTASSILSSVGTN